MTKNDNKNIPDQIYSKFLDNLKKAELPSEVIDNLEKLSISGDISESDLRDALFSASENL